MSHMFVWSRKSAGGVGSSRAGGAGVCGPLDLGIETKLGSSGRAASVLNHCAVSPAPKVNVLI